MAVADRIEGSASEDQVHRFAEWVDEWARDAGLGADVAFAMRLCLEEAATNIVHYGFAPEAPGRVMAAEALPVAGGAELVLSDNGFPFDVTRADEPGREGSAARATVGGRGIRLMRTFSAGMSYELVGERNRLTFSFSDPAPKEAEAAPAPGR